MTMLGRSLLALVAGLVPLLAVAAPAHAGSSVIVDRDDSPALADLLRVTVHNAHGGVTVRLTFDDLVRKASRASQSVGVYFDTKRLRPGPEFGLGSGLNLGTDYQLARMRNWAQTGSPVVCAYDAEVDWVADTATYVVDQACFGAYDKVRVAVESSEFDGDVVLSDWLRRIKAFSPWVRRG